MVRRGGTRGASKDKQTETNERTEETTDGQPYRWTHTVKSHTHIDRRSRKDGGQREHGDADAE